MGCHTVVLQSCSYQILLEMLERGTSLTDPGNSKTNETTISRDSYFNMSEMEFTKISAIMTQWKRVKKNSGKKKKIAYKQ